MGAFPGIQVHGSNGAANEETRSQKLARYELAAVMGTGRGFFPVYIAFCIAAIVIIHPGVSPKTSAVWVTIYLIYTCTRTIATSLYHEDAGRASPRRVQYWRRIVFASGTAHGMLLGSLAIFALPKLEWERQIVLTCFVLFVTAGATLYVSALLAAVMMLITTALIPFAVVWAIEGDKVQMPVAQFLVSAWLLNLFIGLLHHRVGSRILRLASDNDHLVKELEQKNRELQAADRARVQFLAVASHDLRQPVHALGLILAHASEQDDDGGLKQHLEKMTDVSNLISQMLLELMDLSTLESETVVKQSEAVCLTIILQQLRTSQEPLARRKGLALDIQSDDDIWVLAEPSLLRRMLLNLLSNAIKYTVVGRVTVGCDVRQDHVLISVRDTGIGIPRERLQDIFRPYVRLDPRATDSEGVGLGLSIVHRAALVQGLDISVSSTMGVGSVFGLKVPLMRKPVESSSSRMTPQDARPPSGTVIAVVDDDFYTREALVALLRRWGYDVLSGETISELLQALDRSAKPALVIADHHLSPIEFGSDAIVAIRRRFDDISMPGILMTGDTGVVLDGMDHVEIAHKPLNPLVLKQLVLRRTLPASAMNEKGMMQVGCGW